MAALSNVKRTQALAVQVAKVNNPSVTAHKILEAFLEVPAPYAGIVEKEARILRSYDMTINNAKTAQKAIMERLETLSKRITADAKSNS